MSRAVCILAAAAAIGTLGCETYRVEYHTRPGYYQTAGIGPNETVTLDEVSVIVF